MKNILKSLFNRKTIAYMDWVSFESKEEFRDHLNFQQSCRKRGVQWN